MKNLNTDVAVIGAGPAGMLASATASRQGALVTVFERERTAGRKLRITGKGRCNLTNNCSPREIMENLPTNGKFLFSALQQFGPSDVMSYFEALGVPLKTERGRRVFPVSDRADDIAEALLSDCRSAGVRWVRERVRSVEKMDGGGFLIRTDLTQTTSRRVILCTGGCSYPLTGSSGDGYQFARRLGHSVSELRASLVPLLSSDECCRQLQGLSLKNVKFSVYGNDGKALFSELGEMLFTHYGVSGPLVLSASAHIRDWSCGAYRACIDLKPGLDETKLDERVQRDLRENRNRDFLNAIRSLLPAKMLPVIAEVSGIPGDEKANSVTKAQRAALIRNLKSFPLTLTGTRPIEEAIITSGGVNVREINPTTMESKLVPGLFFAGEILDVDGYTGGYNLQVAWATGRAAGIHGGTLD